MGARQKAACGVIALLRGAESKAQLALFVSVKAAVCHSVGRIFLSVNLQQTKRLLRLAPLMHCI